MKIGETKSRFNSLRFFEFDDLPRKVPDSVWKELFIFDWSFLSKMNLFHLYEWVNLKMNESTLKKNHKFDTLELKENSSKKKNYSPEMDGFHLKRMNNQKKNESPLFW